MKRLNLIFIFIFMMGIWVKMPIQLKAQAKFKATKVEMKVKGTSNLHDWDMDVKSVQTEALVQIETDAITLNQGKLRLYVKDIVSGNSSMDKKAHGALKADKNPQIEFVISKPVVLKSNGKGFNGNISGQLMLAGVKKGIAVPVQLSVNGSNQIVIEGSKTLDMKEFQMDPPTAIMGTVKAGNIVEVVFTVEMNKDNTITLNL